MTVLAPTGHQSDRRPARLALGAWIALLVATLIVVPRMTAAIPTPPVGDGARGAVRWAASTDPAFVFAAVLRMLVTALAAYLLTTTLAAVAARGLGARAGRDGAAFDRLVVPPVRRLVAAACGVSLSVGTLAVLDGRAARPAATAIEATTTTTTVVEATTTSVPPPLPAPAPAPLPSPTPAVAEHVVQPGESFWAIAEAELTAAWTAPPTDAEVDPYWRELVAANRDRLAAPAAPDLLFPGQSVRVPPLPQPPVARRS